MSELAGLRVLVTGGASGIGLATAELMHRQGAAVAVLDRAPVGPSIAAQYVAADITDDDAVREGVAATAQSMGGLDVVVNNAGAGAQGTIEANSDADWLALLDINVVGLVRVSRAALPALRESNRAAIINVGSVAANVGLQNRALYTATKGAVVALTRAMAADFMPWNIRVNVVNPGTAATPWVQRLLDTADDPAAERVALARRQPHGRLVEADEVAAAISYLASPSSGSTTGACLDVDGGMAHLRLR